MQLWVHVSYRRNGGGLGVWAECDPEPKEFQADKNSQPVESSQTGLLHENEKWGVYLRCEVTADVMNVKMNKNSLQRFF